MSSESKLIGNGEYGNVFSVDLLDTSGDIVPVCIKNNKVRDYWLYGTATARELQVSCEMSRAYNVCAFYMLVVSSELIHGYDKYGMVFHRCELPNAREYFKIPRPVEDIINVITDILSALAVMEQRQILHGDLSAGNVFLSKYAKNGKERLTAYVGDFGMSTYMQNGECKNYRTTTPYYESPESRVTRSRKLTHKHDVWSCGAIIHYILSRYNYFEYDCDPTDVNIEKAVNELKENYEDNQEFKKAIDIAEMCLVFDPVKRLTAREILEIHKISLVDEIKYVVEESTLQVDSRVRLFSKYIAIHTSRSLHTPEKDDLLCKRSFMIIDMFSQMCMMHPDRYHDIDSSIQLYMSYVEFCLRYHALRCNTDFNYQGRDDVFYLQTVEEIILSFSTRNYQFYRRNVYELFLITVSRLSAQLVDVCRTCMEILSELQDGTYSYLTICARAYLKLKT
jgi:serine/threonine protein kinase